MIPHHVRLIGFVVFGISIGCWAQDAPASAADSPLPQTIDFNRDIRSIISDKCYTCHGPSRQMAGLRFDREEVAKQSLKSGHFAIVPGDADKSEMVHRISSTEAAVRMPLGAPPLTPREIALVRRWVEQGAKWQKHWSLIPPIPPATPAVKDASWVHNPIDAFVLDRLEREGLKPSPQADRATLLRRVTFDLTGLPPTVAELDAFLADQTPKAYEKVVDRLLASPSYGERMAFTWLEASRYADTNGYQGDGERHMWRWRDWVIDTFNRNMPFDEFTVEQLAGDLLPNATVSQKIATGFNRNHRGNSEGGIIPEEYRTEYVIDRAETTGTVFMGLTVGCARCHDHKYDPIKQKDFYSLYSYFNNIPENGKARRVGNSPPLVKAPTPDQQVQLQQYDAKLSAANANFQKVSTELASDQNSWEASLDKSKSVTWGPSRGLVAYYPLDGDTNAKVAIAPEKKQVVPIKAMNGDVPFAAGRFAHAAQFDGKNFLEGGDITGFASHGYYDDKYSLAAWIYPTGPTGAIITKVGDIVEPKGHGLNLKDGKIQYNLVSKWLDEGIRLQTEETIPLNQWHQVTLTYDGTRIAEGVKLYVDGKELKWEILLDDMNNSIALKREPLRIGGGGGPDNRFHGAIQEVRIYDRPLSAAEASALADPSTVEEIASMPAKSRTQAQSDKLRDYFLENAAPAPIQKAWNGLLSARNERDEYYEGLPTVMVMEETAPRESHVLIRGVYDQPGAVVTPTIPDFLTSSASKFPPNRLGLAQWLVDPSNPLMSRVTVNRFWQMYFGIGIVKTVEDFGSQGDSPSNPELLDWLATEFMRTKWDVKSLQKTIVMSATYQQSSRTKPEMAERDPENRLLSHGPRFRLPAAMVRDQALAISGLLTSQIGGPSVKPYQPDGLWQELASQVYTQDHGDKLYRRSIYTFWKRTIPPPTMATFDASSRETCIVRMNITNTPLQALDLMNDVAFIEAARVLAQKVMADGGITSPQERIARIFRLATSRLPDKDEAQILQGYLNFQLDAFASKPDAALKFLSVGEYPRDSKLNTSQLAAYTTLASFVLNLDETITKE